MASTASIQAWLGWKCGGFAIALILEDQLYSLHWRLRRFAAGAGTDGWDLLCGPERSRAERHNCHRIDSRARLLTDNEVLKMNRSRGLTNLVLINAAFLVGVAIPHLIDDFLFGIPDEFGLTDIQAQILAGIFSVLLVVVFSLVARGQRWGFIGAVILGGFLALAGILKHIPLMLQPGPYWSGCFSEGLILLLILSGISLSIVSIIALRANKGQGLQV
jgi:hypothetical protein